MKVARSIRGLSAFGRLFACMALVAGVVPAGAIAGDDGPVAVSGVKASRLAETLPRHDGSAEVRALDGPDFSSMTPIAPGSTNGTFSQTDSFHVFTIDLAADQRISVELEAGADTNYDLYLYREPDAFGMVGSSWLDEYPERIIHDVRAPYEGTYYVVVERFSGVGAYALDVSVAAAPAAEAIHSIPGVPLAFPTVGGSLDRGTEPDHVYSVDLAAGQRLSLLLDHVGGDADLFLFGPAATDVNRDLPIAGAATGSVPELLVYDVPAGAGGTYYVNVWAASGSPVYELTAAVGPTPALGAHAEIPGTPISATPLVGSLAGQFDSLVYALPTASPGDRIELSLSGVEDTDFDVRLFAPDAGSVLSATPVARSEFPFYPDEIAYDVPAGSGGVYYVQVRSYSGAGAFGLAWAVGPRGHASIERLDGENRYLTAVSISENAFDPGSCDTVVLATGEMYADALAASSLAGAYEAPVLLTATNRLPAAVLVEMGRLGATQVLVVGGEVAIGPSVTAALTDAGIGWRRVAGVDRFDTAVMVAEEALAERARNGGVWDGTAFVVRSDGFADALAVAPVAYSRGVPILLTLPGSLNSTTRAGMLTLGVEDVVVAGGTVAVSADTLATITRVPGMRRVDRVSGETRYETAVAVAEYALKFHWTGTGVVGIATGEDFADALSGGAAAGSRGGLLLLTTARSLPAPSSEFLLERTGSVPRIHVYGGTLAVTDSVMDQIIAVALD